MTKPRKPRNASKRAKKEKTQPREETWVDRIDFLPVHAENHNEHATALSIISWNILANSYCSRRSQRNLPTAYQSTVFTPQRRKALICRCLRNLNADVLCLQEVDFDDVRITLQSQGYVGVETPRSQKGGGIGGRVDSCGVYIRDAEWRIVQDELVRLDDLAFMSSEDTAADPNHIQGIQQSFLRRNVALLVRIQHRRTLQTVVVANAHLFWHPGFEYVKVCQAHYVVTRAKKFCKIGEPFLFAGDFNSRPGGATHSYLTQHRLNFKSVAPWYNESGAEDELGKIVNEMGQLILGSERSAPSSPRYLLDFTLNKLCRWLRIMGIDAELETEEEERLRTTTDKDERKMILLDRCREERRTLVTTSIRLTQRKDCPSSAYCISPVGLRNLEAAFAQMLVTHGVVLEPSKFLSRCVVCNGLIVAVKDPSEAKSILKEYQAPEALIQDAEGASLEVFQCDGCRQPYWWCDIPTSSASRVKMTATRLLEICLRAGVPYIGDLGMFDHVQPDQLKAEGLNCPETGSDVLQERLDVIEWLKCENMESPFHLESAYAEKDGDCNLIGELLPFTNVTHDFVDTLDYIFFDPSKLKLTHRLKVPQSLDELNPRSIARGHLLPSNLWPSDHLAVGSRFLLIDGFSTLQDKEQTNSSNLNIPDRSTQKGEHETFLTSNELTMFEFCQPISTNHEEQISRAPPNGTQQGFDVESLEFCQPISANNEENIPSGLSPNVVQQPQGSHIEALIESGQPISRKNETQFPPGNSSQQHDKRCDCGCVPKIPSLFEMAELRRQARLKKQGRL